MRPPAPDSLQGLPRLPCPWLFLSTLLLCVLKAAGALGAGRGALLPCGCSPVTTLVEGLLITQGTGVFPSDSVAW